MCLNGGYGASLEACAYLDDDGIELDVAIAIKCAPVPASNVTLCSRQRRRL